jgi:hypothetical protein
MQNESTVYSIQLHRGETRVLSHTLSLREAEIFLRAARHLVKFLEQAYGLQEFDRRAD